MKILLTGGTGFIGGAVLARLVEDGHEVTAVVRSESSGQVVEEAGAAALQGDLADAGWLAGQLSAHDAAIHTAAGGDAGDPAMNEAVIDAAVDALGGTGKPFVHTGGVWTYGDGADITEADAPDPVELTAWRVEGERRLLASDVKASVVQPGIVYGGGQGIPRVVVDGPRDDQGRLALVGDGLQHWTTVHVEDLADLYVRVLHAAPGGSSYIGVGGESPAVRELAAAVADDVVPQTAEQTRDRLGAAFADALLLDQQARGDRARSLGWEPSRPSLAALLREGY